VCRGQLKISVPALAADGVAVSHYNTQTTGLSPEPICSSRGTSGVDKRAVAGDTPPELDEVLLTALVKEKADRYETVVHLRDDL
jgi:hypothetical protein